jgi:bifunctional non-homologous end joining protein LigD
VIAKRADAPYAPGRSKTWIKMKCLGREEFVVLGFTPPAGSRVGIGALHVGWFDANGAPHYGGGIGTGFDDAELRRLATRLGKGEAKAPPGLNLSGEPPGRSVRWVKPELVIEAKFTGWSGAGRIRHGVYLGLREDKMAKDVVRDADPVPAAPVATRVAARPARAKSKRPEGGRAEGALPAFVVARAPHARHASVAGVRLTHPDRELWPGISKQALAEYWLSVAAHALPGIAARPLALVRCPEGVGGAHFFQKHAIKGAPPALRAGDSGGDPYLAIDDESGLVACAQMSAIELHAWGANEAAPDRPDQLVFDLDPGQGVAFAMVVQAARDLHQALGAIGLAGFCRTTGGKGLHVVVPLLPTADWARAKAFARAFAEGLTAAAPERFVTKVSKSIRGGKILIDWLRNGKGSTAVASFSPRARDGAGVATPLDWKEVTAKLDPGAFTLHTVPARLKAQKRDPWAGFDGARAELPKLQPDTRRA